MLEKLKAWSLPFLAGCAITSASYFFIPVKEVIKIVKTEEHAELKQEVAKQSVEIKAVEVHETRGRVVTLQKSTHTRPDGSKTVLEKKVIEEPVEKETKEVVQSESKELDKVSLDNDKKSESVTISKPSMSRYSIGLQAAPLDVAKGNVKEGRVEGSVRLGNLPVWGTVSSDLGLKVNVGLRLEF